MVIFLFGHHKQNDIISSLTPNSNTNSIINIVHVKLSNVNSLGTKMIHGRKMYTHTPP